MSGGSSRAQLIGIRTEFTRPGLIHSWRRVRCKVPAVFRKHVTKMNYCRKFQMTLRFIGYLARCYNMRDFLKLGSCVLQYTRRLSVIDPLMRFLQSRQSGRQHYAMQRLPRQDLQWLYAQLLRYDYINSRSPCSWPNRRGKVCDPSSRSHARICSRR